MDPFVKMEILVDVNDAGLLRFRVSIDSGDGENPWTGEGYSIEEATRDAVKKAVQAVTG